MQETWVWCLGWEDPLVKEMATHSSILAWRILWTEETGGLQSMGSQWVGHNWATNRHTNTTLLINYILQFKMVKKKVAEQRIIFQLLEVYENIVMGLMWTDAKTKDFSAKKFAATMNTPSPLRIKGAWILI